MKQIVSVILVLTMLLGVHSTVSAAARQERSVVEIIDATSRKKHQLNTVNLMVGGKDVITDVPGVIFNNRTLVPIRFVVESLGAKIDWNQSTYEATITTDSKTIVLKVDSSTAIVNGTRKKLPDGVPPKLFAYQGNNRTMVPIRFISEELGMDVNWIGNTNTVLVDFPMQNITGIDYNESGQVPQLVIKTSGPVEATHMFLPGSKYGGQDRLVLDIPNAVLDLDDSSFVEHGGSFKKNIEKNGINSIRASLFQLEPRKVTRLVIDLDYQKGYNVQTDKATNEIRVEFLNSVRNVKVERINSTEVVVIQTEESPVYNTINLGNRVVVDVLNASLKFDKSDMPVSRGGISRIRTAIFKPDSNYSPDDKIVRVVLDLEPGQTSSNLFVEHIGNDIHIYLNDNPLKGLEYNKYSMNQSMLQLSLFKEGQAELTYNDDKRTLNIKIEKTKMNLSSATLDISDNLVESIVIDDEYYDKHYSIDVKLARDVNYKIATANMRNIDIRFTNAQFTESELSKYKGRIIAIDAGHGGRDPGAISPVLQLREKDLAMDVSLRLNKLLEEAGFTTYLVRDGDYFVGLYERAAAANELDADVFVSIHYNAHSNNEISGVQVLYNPDPVRDNKTFARIMQDELLKELKAVDRNIVERPNLVVTRETKMPAVIVEMAFLTNREEERLASIEEHRQKGAQAIFNGLIRYFDQVILKK